jgi:hypothetical protein
MLCPYSEDRNIYLHCWDEYEVYNKNWIYDEIKRRLYPDSACYYLVQSNIFLFTNQNLQYKVYYKAINLHVLYGYENWPFTLWE